MQGAFRRAYTRAADLDARLVAGSVASSLQCPKGLLYAERSRDLAGRVLPERLQELSHDDDGRLHRPKLLPPPARVQGRFLLVPLPRVRPEVGHQGDVGAVLLAGEQVPLDGLEADLPFVV